MFDDTRAQFFPVTLSDDTRIETIIDTGDFWQHAAPLMDKIFPPYSDLGAYGHAIPEERRNNGKPLSKLFRQTHHEYFLFWQGDTVAGFAYGDMRDTQTFFMTSTGVLPAYQRRGIYSGFLRQLLHYLYAIGYERVLSNHHPNNRAVIIAKLKAGFNITAVNLDERWGAQVELTYLFHEDRRDAYASAFSLEQRDTPNSHK